MPKINVYLPDDLADAVRDTGVPVSAICQRALSDAVRRITTIRQTALTDLDDAGWDPATLSAFTGRATTVLSLAIDRARDTGAPTVGTAHLLHGLLAEGTNLALQILTALEIDPRRIAAALAEEDHAEENAAGAGGGLHFSAAAATALELTVADAMGLGHNYVGCEHLLLGLCAEPDGVAGRALRAAGADPRGTRRAVTAALAGYRHLRAQTPATDRAAYTAVQVLIRQELQPLADRIERLEKSSAQRGGAAA
jgi:ATP-dependent Clp protease ATP-binding subunit ClpC